VQSEQEARKGTYSMTRIRPGRIGGFFLAMCSVCVWLIARFASRALVVGFSQRGTALHCVAHRGVD